MLASGYPDAAAGEAYYAMFSAARALLATKDVIGSKTHASTIAQFGMLFVKTGIVDKKFGRMLNEAEEIRNTADYQPATMKQEEVEPFVTGAFDFIEAVVKGIPANEIPHDLLTGARQDLLDKVVEKIGGERLERERLIPTAAAFDSF
jgi:uncharacterized protein (UPF0332 family)